MQNKYEYVVHVERSIVLSIWLRQKVTWLINIRAFVVMVTQ